MFWPRIESPIWREELAVFGMFRGLLELSLGASPPETPPPAPISGGKNGRKTGKTVVGQNFHFSSHSTGANLRLEHRLPDELAVEVRGISVRFALLLRGWRWQGRTAFPTSAEQELSGCETLATTRSRIALCHACSGVSAAEQKSGRSAAKVTFVAQGVPERHGDAGNSPRIKKFSRRRGHDAVLPFSSPLLMTKQACTCTIK